MNNDEIIERAKELLSGKEDCPECGGTGFIWAAFGSSYQVDCKNCKGTGKVEAR